MIENIIAFLIYSYLGASFEHINYFFSNSKKALSNPIITGFPLYGLGAYSIIITNNYLSNTNIFLKILIFALVLSIIELITGLYVGAGITNSTGIISSWDYSNEPYNYKGIIDIKHFIIWGLLGVIITYIHPIIIKKIKYGIYSV